MKVTEADVQHLYQRMTARAAGADCPGEDALTRVALGEADRDEREKVVAHIARCSDCAREYQVARGLLPLRGGAAAQRNALPLAAMLVLALIGLAWMTVIQQRNVNRIASLEQQLASRPVPAARIAPTPPAAQVGMPIVDLDSDPSRGVPRQGAAIDLPKGVDLYTVILHLPADFDGVLDSSIDGGDRFPATAANGTLTVTLHRAASGPGSHVIRVRSSTKELAFPFVVHER